MYGNILVKTSVTSWKTTSTHWEGSLKPIEHDGRFSEFEFRIESDDPLWFTGKIDTVGGPRRCVAWSNTRRSVVCRVRMSVGDQFRLSLLPRCRGDGLPTLDGVLWDYISSKPCNVPGRVNCHRSRSVRLRSTRYQVGVEAWIEEEGHKRKDFKKMLADAEANRRNRFIPAIQSGEASGCG
jgi:hypothetical protein